MRKAILLSSLGAALALPMYRPSAFAGGVTQIADVVVPEIFGPYAQVLTAELSRLVQSGAVSNDSVLAGALAGGGLTFNEPSFLDLDDDEENTSSDDPASLSTPKKIATTTEVQVRINRNQSWSSMDLAADLAGADPMSAIANRVAAYWTRRMQTAFIAVLSGVFADNAAAASGTDTHTVDDLTHDISGVAHVAGVTDFSAEAYLDAKVTMGDNMGKLTMVMMHSIVYNRAQKNNLIDFIPDSRNPAAESIPTFLGAEVIVDDGVTNAAGVFHTWLFGAGAFRWGNGSAKRPTETLRVPGAGDGAGQDLLWSRVEWALHPVGHAYIGTGFPKGGPKNTTGTAPLNAAASWSRVWPERKQIKIARLITREF